MHLPLGPERERFNIPTNLLGEEGSQRHLPGCALLPVPTPDPGHCHLQGLCWLPALSPAPSLSPSPSPAFPHFPPRSFCSLGLVKGSSLRWAPPKEQGGAVAIALCSPSPQHPFIRKMPNIKYMSETCLSERGFSSRSGASPGGELEGLAARRFPRGTSSGHCHQLSPASRSPCVLPAAQVEPSPNLCRNPLQLVLAATLSFQEERDGPKTFPIPGSSDLRCLGAARPRLQPAARCAVPPLSPRALLPPAGHPAPSSGSRRAGEPREPLSPKAGLAERLCHRLWGGAGTTPRLLPAAPMLRLCCGSSITK